MALIFGVLTLYRTRAGQAHWLDRRVDKLFTAILMFGVQPVLFVVLLGTTPFSELVWALLPVPAASLEWASHVAVGVAVVLFAGYVVFELRKPNRSLPKLLYAVVIVLHPTLLYAAVRSGEVLLGVLYVVAYLWSHWLIAVGLVARINTRLYRSRGEPARAAWLRHAAIVLGIAGLVLVVTAPYLDYLLFDTSDHAYKARLAEIASGREWLLGLVMGFFLAEQLVHYYCDRCLFRFRNPAVRARVAPLLLGAPSPDGA